MKRTYSTNRIVVFSFIVISFATLSAGLFMFFTNADVKKEVPKVSSNIIQTPRPTILPSVYPACDGFGEDKKWGLIDAKGDFVVEPKYDEIADFQENGYAVVKNIIDSKNDYKQLVGLIDSTGKEVLPLIYSSISDFKEGLSSLTVEGSKEVKVINEKLEKVFSLKADYIEDFHDGVAVYSKTVKDEYLSGYVDKSGKILAKAIFAFAGGTVFGGKALASDFDSEGNARIIDTSGKILVDLSQYINVSQLENGLLTFANVQDGKVGLMDMNGKVIIQPAYANIDEFMDGFAVVSMSDDSKNKTGVIKENGDIVIPVKVQNIQNFGKGMFGVYKNLFEDGWGRFESQYAKNALMDVSGKLLTDYRFYNVSRNIDGNYSVSDGVKTFLVDQKGEELKDFPMVSGVGTITKIGALYKCDIDGILSYVDSNGKKVWKQDMVQSVAPYISAETAVFRNDYLRVVKYPVFSLSEHKNVQNQINARVKKIFINHITPTKEWDLEFETIDIHFGTKMTGDILTVILEGDVYPIGAVHGNSFKEIYHFDIWSGETFDLSDLFKDGIDYKSKLNAIIRKQAMKETGGYFEPAKITINGKNTVFDVSKKAVTIYFMPYEVAPYAAGMPEFEIKFFEIESIINKDGAFWTALQAEGPQP